MSSYTHAKSRNFKPKTFTIIRPMFEIHVTPLSVFEALTDSRWKQAMMNEYQALMKNNTWEIVPVAENQHIVSNKWVLSSQV